MALRSGPPEALRELEVAGPVPRLEIPEWRTRFGVVAGITGRGTDPGRGFDLGLWTAAPVGEVMSRWRAFRRAEPGFDAVILGNQVHQTGVAWHQAATGWVQMEGVDGHATASRGLLLTVTVADCIPVFLLAPRIPAIALLHSGWRGTAGGILRAGVEALVEHAAVAPAELVMHCGVGICGDCYEVGPEVRSGCGLGCEGPGPYHVDLRQVLVQQARGLGIERISTSQWCSGHDRGRFYSHRASGGRDGRMVAYLGIPRPPQGPTD
jgi:copper oxidase (laccase) domain-containing protein